MEDLAATLAGLRGVVAVSLGGSRARGTERSDSDWDFCLYYRGLIDAADVAALGFPGQIFRPGDWGRLLNGGAWLTIDGQRVDLLYRDLGLVECTIAEARVGRFAIEEAQGYLAGLPSYFLVGEVALARVLTGTLPPASFFPRLRRSAPPRWQAVADFSLREAAFCADREEPLTCGGLLAKAALSTAHARLAERGEWVFNEKGLLRRAGLVATETVLADGIGGRGQSLRRTVGRMGDALRLDCRT